MKNCAFSHYEPEMELFVPQTGGELSSSIVQNWTLQAVECYMLRAKCSNCSIQTANYSFVCQMPKIVQSLLKSHGEPPAELKESLLLV